MNKIFGRDPGFTDLANQAAFIEIQTSFLGPNRLLFRSRAGF